MMMEDNNKQWSSSLEGVYVEECEVAVAVADAELVFDGEGGCGWKAYFC